LPFRTLADEEIEPDLLVPTGVMIVVFSLSIRDALRLSRSRMDLRSLR